MTAFPQTIHFIGTNTPRRVEMSVRNLEVEGEIPSAVDGAFFRAVPDNAHAPMFADDIALNHDGMVARFNIEGGAVDFDIRYVDTERYLAEKSARRALFGQYRNPFTDDPLAAGVDRTLANTTPVWHAGQLFMTKEDGRGYEVNPHTLATVGKWDYEGKLRTQTFTAHPRVDPVTGEMFFFGYEAGGLCDPNVAYCIADKDGNLVKEQWFEQPYLSTIHDFVITEKYAIFPIFPTLADLDRLKAGGAHWAHHQDKPSWVGIMPRYGDVSEMRWIEGPVGVSCFHEVNGFDANDGGGDLVHIDLCLSDSNAFPFMREAGGIHREQQSLQGAVTRWTIDMSKPELSIEQRPLGPPGDLCRVADADQGRPYNRAWYLSMNPQAKGPPMVGGPVGANFNALLRIEPGNGRISALEIPPGAAISEPAHVPSPDVGHGGWLLAVIDVPNSPNPSDYSSELWIVEADNIEAGPVAKVKTGLALRSQVHGTWVSRERMETSKRKAAWADRAEDEARGTPDYSLTATQAAD